MNDLKSCVYTAAIGSYEPLQEQEQASSSSLPFICFTDDENLRSSTWDIRLVKPMFPMDPIRSQRWIKLNPHRLLPDFDTAVYIDNTIRLLAGPEAVLRIVGDDPIGLIPHSFRASVADEFIEVSRLGFDDQTRVFEQMNHYYLSDPEVMAEQPYWSGLMVLRHSHADVRSFLDRWTAHVLRYSRRDQLSLNAVLRMANIKPHRIDIDNFLSPYHRWAASGRDRNKAVRDPRVSHMPVQARLREVEMLLEQSEAARARSAPATPSGCEGGDAAEARDGSMRVLSGDRDSHRHGPHLVLDRQRPAASAHDMLGALVYSGTNAAGHQVPFAEDFSVAREVGEAQEVGERWFSIRNKGQTSAAMVLARPNVDRETALFILVREDGEDGLHRVVLHRGEDGFATLKIKME